MVDAKPRLAEAQAAVKEVMVEAKEAIASNAEAKDVGGLNAKMNLLLDSFKTAHLDYLAENEVDKDESKTLHSQNQEIAAEFNGASEDVLTYLETLAKLDEMGFRGKGGKTASHVSSTRSAVRANAEPRGLPRRLNGRFLKEKSVGH